MNANTLKAIVRHGESLLAAFPNSTEKDPVALCKKLRRIESSIAPIILRHCNQGVPDDEMATAIDKTLKRVRTLLGLVADAPESKGALSMGLFVNCDPRGCALKLDDAATRQYNARFYTGGAANKTIPKPIYTDWGGYGLLAPDLNQ